jgi:anti-anti-sigma factor
VGAALDVEPREFVLDLSAVGFIDSSGLATIVDASRRAQQAGIDFGVLPGEGKVRQVLQLTKIDRRLRMLS